MLNKELKYVHDKGFIQQHPALQPKMRSILLDWLIEVCLFSSTIVIVLVIEMFNMILNSFCEGQRSLYSAPRDILLGSGHL